MTSATGNAESPRAKQIAAAVIGNALEWYDFVIFGYFASVLSQVFFPSSDETASLLLTLATFGAGFCTRPIGGVFFGLYADRSGRKAALQLIMLLMTIAIGVIAFAPSYATIGVFAPQFVVVGRLLQGFATGGEFSSSTSFLIEIAPPERRGLFGSLQMVGQGFAILLGALAGIGVTSNFSTAEISAYAWRLPFIAGLLIRPVGLYVRRHLDETPAFMSALHERVRQQAPLVEILQTKSFVASFATTVSATIYFYIVLVYMPTYGKSEMGLSLRETFVAQAFGLVVLIALTPMMGALSDRIGRRPILLASHILFLLAAWPLFAWLQAARTPFALACVETAFCIIVSGVFGVLSTTLAEHPTRIRATSLAIAYNIAVMIFGGFAPFLVTWLIRFLQTPLAPAFYLMFGAVVGLIAVGGLRDVGKLEAV